MTRKLSSDKSTDRAGLSMRSMIAYSLPGITYTMLWNPVFVLQGVYVKYFGFPMALFAAILLASRLFDAVIDPLIGAGSDWWKERTGKRKPFIIAGGVCFIISAALLYIPPSDPSVLYVTIALFAFFSGSTCFFIPHVAWGGEIARTSQEKTRLFGYHVAAGYFGLAFLYSIPMAPFFETSAITPTTLQVSMLIAAVLFIPTMFLCMRYVPEAGTIKSEKGVLSLQTLKSITANKPFLMYITAYGFASVGLGCWYGMIFLFVDVYLDLAVLFAPLYLLAFAVSACSPFFWNLLARKLGKKSAWTASIGVALIGVFGTAFIHPGQAPIFALALVMITTTCALASNDMMPRSVLGDVIDYATLRNGANQAATYFAIHLFMVKAAFAIGGGISFGLAGAMGFDPTASEQSAAGARAITLAMVVLPAIFLLLAALLVRLIPIDERRHDIIRRALDKRSAIAQ